jgi:hypothetical protein
MAQEINEGRSAFKFGDEDDEKDTFEYDRLKKRRERLQKESDNIKKAITDQQYMRMVERFQKNFDNLMKELL